MDIIMTITINMV